VTVAVDHGRHLGDGHLGALHQLGHQHETQRPTPPMGRPRRPPARSHLVATTRIRPRGSGRVGQGWHLRHGAAAELAGVEAAEERLPLGRGEGEGDATWAQGPECGGAIEGSRRYLLSRTDIRSPSWRASTHALLPPVL
jgi:hypothetical protein